MIGLPNGFLNRAIAALKVYGADPLLGFVLFVVFAAALIYGKADPLALLGGLVVIWAGYHARCVASERHKERMAEIRVDNLEKTRGTAIRNRQRTRLAKSSGKKAAVKGN